jgi:hypothetical protein
LIESVESNGFSKDEDLEEIISNVDILIEKMQFKIV